MTDELSLTPTEQRDVTFYDDSLTAVKAEDGRVYASLRHMCQALDIDTTGQRQRIQRHRVLNNGLGVCKIQTPGGVQQTYVLRVDLVPLWLTGIRTSMVAEAIRPKLEQFQEKAADVLWEAFQEGRLSADPLLDELLQQDTEAVQAYRMLQAMVKLARNQVLLEAQLGAHTTQLADHEQRLEEIEATLGDTGRNVTPEQASQLSQAVKAVAIALSKQTRKNEFGAVYGELYRKFGITSYKLLPAHQFDAAMRWLTDWHQTLVTDTPF